MKSTKIKCLLIIGFLLLLSLAVGFSYALWTITKTQETTSVLNTGCFSTTLTDQNNISLTNSFPETDKSGLTLQPYQFTIKNTCTINAKYQINLESLNTTTINLSNIKISLNGNTPYLVNNLTSVDKTLSDASNAYLLGTGNLTAGSSVTYYLRLWLSENATQEDVANKIFSSKISVTTTVNNIYTDATGASIPELYKSLIPIKYDASGNTVVADTSKEWYDYNKHNWANAVFVNISDSTIKSKYFNNDLTLKSSSIGTIIDESEIVQYYVWIPRFKYQLWNALNGSSNPQPISITFERSSEVKSNGTTNQTWLTHPAFTFGSEEINGFWVGKFENSGTTDSLKIKPNERSLTNINVGTMFNSLRNEEQLFTSNFGVSSLTSNIHMMKNMEWGAVAYLTSSIYGRYADSSTCIASGCEVWINNVNTAASGSNGPTITGCAGDSVSSSVSNSLSACVSGYDWKTNGMNASTTGNQYGIYDMSGGNIEYVMGNMVDLNGNFYSSSSGLTQPDGKYYDSYAFDLSNNLSHARGKLGDATKETLSSFGTFNGGWNTDYAYMPTDTGQWITRGGLYNNGINAGIFFFGRNAGGASLSNTYRSVMIS